MKADLSSMHLQGITDLTLLAPIKKGLIDGLHTRTFKTRLKILLQTLDSLRSAFREFLPIRPFSDGAERIRTIHSLRLAIIEPDDKLLLAVTFDRSVEPYIRTIWRDVGTLLDVIFCNCAGYVSAYDHSFAEYISWVRKAQIEAQYFYSAGPLTVDDLQYLANTERLHRENIGGLAASDVSAAQLLVVDPAVLAAATAIANLGRPGETLGETEKLGLTGLAALYNLTELYPADRADGGYLLRAAHEILKEFRPPVVDTKTQFPNGSAARIFFSEQLAWFEQSSEAPKPPPEDRLGYNPKVIQGGIITSYPKITHGCLVLIGIVDAAQACQFLRTLPITTEQSLPVDGIFTNVALTHQGLQRLRVAEQEINKLPKEFREGMEARADFLGDFRSNHPDNWKLPDRNWPNSSAGQGIVERVQLSEVDIVVQLRTSSTIRPGDDVIVGNRNHPLFARVEELSLNKGVKILSVQAMLRYGDPKTGTQIEHFGFVDGISQPVVKNISAPGVKTKTMFWGNRVKRNLDLVSKGEMLCGYVNDSNDPPPPKADGKYLDNGTFLVVRKLRQDVQALNNVIKSQALPADFLKAKMLGRKLDGTPLADPSAADLNDFDYSKDSDGSRCPFQAHIRRANPRNGVAGKPIPRIMRRGMSYGPKYEDSPNAERGLIFLAYAARIAEQFEVIQRWVSGGNSTGIFSGEGDPLLGVPQRGDPRTFRYQDAGTIQRVALDPRGSDAAPIVTLEWGIYLFVPSIDALKRIATPSRRAPAAKNQRGEKIVQRLLAMEQQGCPSQKVIDAWKTYLEDFGAIICGDTQAVWKAIRENHDGVLRSAYGVLVGSEKLVMKVFQNAAQNYSVCGYQPRMDKSIGKMYLGMDAGPEYSKQSYATNAAISSISQSEAFGTSRESTIRCLKILLNLASNDEKHKEMIFDAKDLADLVLAVLSTTWFGLPNDIEINSGGWSWTPANKRRPRCPGDFTAPSRYLFSPDPGKAPIEYGQTQGAAVRQAVLKFVKYYRQKMGELTGTLSVAMFNAIADDDLLARTIAGVMMGFLPTVDGNLRSVLYQWMDDKSLWRLQEAYLSAPERKKDPHAAAVAVLLDPLRRAMQLRPVPGMVWRTAKRAHRLGRCKVNEKDVIVVGIISATQEMLAAGRADVFPVFGGNRNAVPPSSSPTHACPAYEMGMGVLLGIICGLFEAGTLWPTPSPTALKLKSQ
jgi:Dyp-type peroxidase family